MGESVEVVEPKWMLVMVEHGITAWKVRGL